MIKWNYGNKFVITQSNSALINLSFPIQISGRVLLCMQNRLKKEHSTIESFAKENGENLQSHY